MDKKEIKNHILTAEYGRFDFLPSILKNEILMMAPPRLIVAHLAVEIGIDKHKIPMPTLRSWLFNYRKKAIKTNPLPTQMKPNQNPQKQVLILPIRSKPTLIKNSIFKAVFLLY